MKHFRHILFLLTTILTILCTDTFQYEAIAETSELPMGIKAILPDNQKTGVTGYFDLETKPGEKQTVYIQITNNKKEDIIVNLLSTNAYTQPTGGIFYDLNVKSPETSLLDDSFALSKNISVDSEVSIKANQSVKVPVEITVPDMDKGTIIGGVLIGEKVDIDEKTEQIAKKDTAEFKVITKTAFALAIKLDLPEQAKSDFSFGKAGFNSVGPNVFIEMRNDAPMIQREISGEYQVSDKNGEELFKGKFEPIIMAPKTKINFPMKWDSPVIEPGKYTISMTSNVSGKEMLVEENFNIDNDEVKKYGERTNQPIAKTQTGIPYWVAIVSLIIIICIVYWFAKREKKN